MKKIINKVKRMFTKEEVKELPSQPKVKVVKEEVAPGVIRCSIEVEDVTGELGAKLEAVVKFAQDIRSAADQGEVIARANFASGVIVGLEVAEQINEELATALTEMVERIAGTASNRFAEREADNEETTETDTEEKTEEVQTDHAETAEGN